MDFKRINNNKALRYYKNMSKNLKFLLFVATLGLPFITAPARAQSVLLSLPYLIDQASLNHPSVRSAKLDARASTEDLIAAQRQRWPTLSAVLENGSKATSTSMPSRVMRLEQNLWDAGRNSARVAEFEAVTDTSQTRVHLQQQLLALQTISAWQGLLAAHAKVQVAEATLATLAEYRVRMQRRIAAELSPAIDLELVQSRMLQTQVELTNGLNGIKTTVTKLEQLSGVSGLAAHVSQLPAMPGLDATVHMPALFRNADWARATTSHPAVAKARLEAQAGEFRSEAKQAEKWPQLYARVDQPIAGSNGKTTGFVGLRFSPGAGFSTLAEAQALSSRAASLAQATETVEREVAEAIQNDRDEFFNSRERIQALASAVDGSDKVLDSYSRQFTAGRKTWQDLLNAVREVAQNQYALADANASMYGAMHRLQTRLGQGISTVALTSAPVAPVNK